MNLRFFFGCGLLILLLLLGLGALAFTGNYCHALSQDLDSAIQALNRGDILQGLLLIGRAKDLWASHYTITAALCDHAPLDEIDVLFAQMEQLQNTGRFQDLALCCAQLSERIRAVRETHLICWWNLL